MRKVRPALIPGRITSLLASLEPCSQPTHTNDLPLLCPWPVPLAPSRTGTKLLRVVEFIFLAAFLAVGCFIFVRQEAPVTGSLQAWVLFKMLFAPLSTIIFNIVSLYRSELANWLHRVQQRLRGGYTMVQGGSWTR